MNIFYPLLLCGAANYFLQVIMLFSRYERFVFFVVFLLAILDLIIISFKDIRVDWAGYAWPSAVGAGMIALGLFFRRVRHSPKIAETLILTAGYILFTLVGSIFNYMLLPIHFARVDDFWIGIDQMMGYDWPSLVIFFAQWPTLSELLKAVYSTSIVQLLLTVLLLGFSGRSRQLSHFLITGIVGALLCIMTWAIFPSFGPAAGAILPDNLELRLGLTAGPSYGAEIVRLSKEGVDYLTPDDVLGLIAFPSYHTIMAVMAVFFTWHFAWMRAPMLFLNTLMVPALLLHGGHHLSDFFGGLAAFAIACMIAGRIVNALSNDARAISEHVVQPL